MTPLASCSPVSDHIRTDVCSATSCSSNATNGQLYTKGVPSCTTIPFYFPVQIPNASGNSWYGVSQMKDNSSVAADWGIGAAHSGESELVINSANASNPFNTIYYSHTPITAGIWHTASICT